MSRLSGSTSRIFQKSAEIVFGENDNGSASESESGLTRCLPSAEKFGLPVWGTASPGEKVTVNLLHQTVTTVARDGQWMVRLKPMEVGGPYTMTITGENSVTKLRRNRGVAVEVSEKAFMVLVMVTSTALRPQR